MLVQESELYLYHLTLKRQSNYVHSCIGHFVEEKSSDKTKRPKDLQLCIATETHIELYDVADGALLKLAEVPIFATITAMESFRVENVRESFLAMVSDSGNLTIAKFNRRSNVDISLETLINHPMTRSQIRRTSPASFLKVDTFGRCILVSAVEKNKLCFVVNEGGDGSVMIQSPLEVIRPEVLTLDLVSCDVQYDNPCFASIEIDTLQNKNDHHLVFYVLDLGLNFVVKKADYTINGEANFLMGLPVLSKYNINCANEKDAHDEINPFVLIGFQDYLLVKDMSGLFSLKVQIPKRAEESSQKVSIISSAIQMLKNSFFILLQSNLGDLYRLTIEANEEDRNRPVVSISYFDTIFQAEKLHIFRNGYLYANSELNDNYLFQFDSLGDDNTEILSSRDPKEQLFFKPSKTLKNISIVSHRKNLNPLLTTQVLKAHPLMIAAGTTSKSRLLSNGVNFEEQISSPLPPGAQDLWTIKPSGQSFHKLLFLGFSKSTMVLKIDEGSIEELSIPQNPFKLNGDRTVLVATLGYRSTIQVCENELRQVVPSGDEMNQFSLKLEWFPPAGIRIVTATSSETQLCLGLSNNELVYFEISEQTDALHESQNRIEIEEPISIVAMSASRRSDFLAVGTKDSTVEIVSLKMSDTEEFMEVVSIQTLLAPVNSLRVIENKDLELHIGLQNGVYYRSKINRHDGQIYDVRTKFIGPKPIVLSSLKSTSLSLTSDKEDDEEENAEGNEDSTDDKCHCVVLHCTKTWISYTKNKLLNIRPVLFSRLSGLSTLCEFVAEETSINVCCAISSSGSLVIGRLTDFVCRQKWFQVTDTPLERILGKEADKESDSTKGGDEVEGDEEDENEEEEEEESLTLQWHTYDRTKFLAFPEDRGLFLQLESSSTQNGARISISKNQQRYQSAQGCEIFKTLPNINVLAASLVKFASNVDHLVISSRDGVLHTFEISLDKGKCQFNLRAIHETVIEGQVRAMIPFADKLLVPAFGSLILFGLGKKQLLKQSISETTLSMTKVTALANWRNERIAVGDGHESVTLFVFDKTKKSFVPIADDTIKRHTISLAFLDPSTILGGDRFGNIWTLRLSKEYEGMISTSLPPVVERMQQLPSLKRKAPNIMECPFKLTQTNMFYINDIAMDFHVLQSVQMSDRPAIIYSGLQGTIGCLTPLLSKAEITKLKTIETVMSEADDKFYMKHEIERRGNEAPTAVEDAEIGALRASHNGIPEGSNSIVGREQSRYRGYYAPVRNVIDGDLCERFLDLLPAEQSFLCAELKTLQPDAVVRSLNDIRTNYM
ncbi:hypothetical protein HG536_0G04410 [Torulaspora globosa]|uniref:Cleavage/polyadenylation specificity factor A subunit C-terminal domain-containing protein n=1 Tax=Torulaspora globosa TaxID=48254 RepID=A0A7G3ZM43_9SACH|nr:uncharacterized protein HG536_0G04410 [Torulaspora globosa]QLL34579.1 hypothetical protein HG536_0G04410 [Torulaspora globosa]